MPEKPESEKKSHQAVDFEHPAEGKDECWKCEHYIPAKHTGGDPRCQMVKAPITYADWCRLFEEGVPV